jgi:hypothetical protein
MPTDATTRLLLAGILACLIVLVVQGLGSGPRAGGALEEGGAGRYDVFSTRAGTPVLIRTDTATGRVWKLELRGGRDRWIQLIEPDEKPAGTREDAASQAEPVPAAPEPPAPEPATPSIPAPEPAAAPSPEPAAAAGDDLATYLEAVRKTDLPPDIRIWAVTQLGASDDPRSTEALAGALRDADLRVAAAAVAAVATRRDDPRVAEALAALRASPDPAIQAALAALGGD